MNDITKEQFVNLSEWVHGAVEGCDGEFLEISNTIQKLLNGYKEMRDFKIQEMQSGNADADNGGRTAEVIGNLLYCCECPFGMGYDYYIDMGAAAHVWNTAIASVDEVVECVAHHLKHRESDGVLADKFWNWNSKYNKGPQCTLNLHIEGETVHDVVLALHRVVGAASIDAAPFTTQTSSFKDKSLWYLDYSFVAQQTITFTSAVEDVPF